MWLIPQTPPDPYARPKQVSFGRAVLRLGQSWLDGAQRWRKLGRKEGRGAWLVWWRSLGRPTLAQRAIGPGPRLGSAPLPALMSELTCLTPHKQPQQQTQHIACQSALPMTRTPRDELTILGCYVVLSGRLPPSAVSPRSGLSSRLTSHRTSRSRPTRATCSIGLELSLVLTSRRTRAASSRLTLPSLTRSVLAGQAGKVNYWTPNRVSKG